MILPFIDDDFARLLEGCTPRGLRLPDSALAPPEVLAMLRELASGLG